MTVCVIDKYFSSLHLLHYYCTLQNVYTGALADWPNSLDKGYNTSLCFIAVVYVNPWMLPMQLKGQWLGVGKIGAQLRGF